MITQAAIQPTGTEKITVRIRQSGIVCEDGPYEDCSTEAVTRVMRKNGLTEVEARIGVGCDHVFTCSWTQNGGSGPDMDYGADDFEDVWEDDAEDWDWSDDGNDEEEDYGLDEDDDEDEDKFGFSDGEDD